MSLTALVPTMSHRLALHMNVCIAVCATPYSSDRIFEQESSQNLIAYKASAQVPQTVNSLT